MNKDFSNELYIWYESMMDYYVTSCDVNRSINLNKISSKDRNDFILNAKLKSDELQMFFSKVPFPEKILDMDCVTNFSSRKKSQEAIVQKYEKKIINKHIKFKKIYNDLFAFRIIIDKDLDEFNEQYLEGSMLSIVEHPKKNKKGKYRAIHIYLNKRRETRKKENKSYIPEVEIQIWYINDVDENRKSHITYKSASNLRDIF